MGLAANRYFLPVTRELVRGNLGQETPLSLFRRIGIPKSPGYRTLKFYEVHGAIRTDHGRIEADPRRVLSLQGGLRAERAMADRHFIKGPPLKEAVHCLEEETIGHALGFQTAANIQAYFEPSGANTLYIHRPAKPTDASRLTGRILNLFVQHPAASPTQPYELYVDDLQRLDVQQGPQGPMTSPLQTLLDLALHHRTAAHREFLYDALRKQGAIHA